MNILAIIIQLLYNIGLGFIITQAKKIEDQAIKVALMMFTARNVEKTRKIRP
jgi:hypothetical protein